jgi:queuine tRNA-ribosyltransferase
MHTYTLQTTDPRSRARAGVFSTAHGDIETPVFMPVGTQASVKSLSPAELVDCGATIILANTYHLYLRPGDTLVREAGGLHRFEHWDRPILTDSGGFQVFSLRDISKITEEGVWFQSYIDGSKHYFSPENVMAIEHNLGADIIMMFDECPPGTSDAATIQKATERTLRWAARCIESHQRIGDTHGYPQALFGIVQGGTIRELRQRCAAELVAMDLPGYAVGGLAVGESMADMYGTAGFTVGLLPVNKPRYLMGVGMPHDILECIERGVDMFDCVLPTRNGRNGGAFTWRGKFNIKNAANTRAFDDPIDSECSCYACRTFSRAYLRHLYMAGEILGIRMLTLHNVHFYTQLAATARKHIFGGTFVEWKRDVLSRMRAGPEDNSEA